MSVSGEEEEQQVHSGSMARFAVDTGGTFTDVVALDARGELHIHKLLSSPRDPSESIQAGVEELVQELLHPCYVLTHGTTVATNALLERKGALTALLTTSGFEDLLEIGRQYRPSLYALHVEKEAPIIAREHVFGVTERIGADGHVHHPLTEDAIDKVVERILSGGYDAVAICLLHAYLHPEHERRLVQALQKGAKGRRDELFICASHEVVREMREYERASTVAMNAYVGPTMHRYLARLQMRLPGADAIEVFESSGVRVPIARASTLPVHTTLSGPAGGVLGALRAASELGLDRIITFDMGGTSTDVSLCKGGKPSMRESGSVGSWPILAPMLDIHTVGAGGGSIARVDAGGALKVGPESAAADPGPACYGKGGRQVTVTDAHAVLGRLRPEHFLGGAMTLHVDAARTEMKHLADELEMPLEATALGVLDVADAAMMRAIKTISLERGEEPADYTLVSFGGAGGLHACRLAEKLGMRQVLVPAHPGLLSAYGMLHARRRARESRTWLERWSTITTREPVRLALLETLQELLVETRRKLLEQQGAGIQGARRCQLTCELRYKGQSFTLAVPLWSGEDAPSGGPTASLTFEAFEASLDTLIERFEQEHERLYGWLARGRELEVVMLRCSVEEDEGKGVRDEERTCHERLKYMSFKVFSGDLARADVFFSSQRGEEQATILERHVLEEEMIHDGPCVVVEYSGTTVIPSGWRLHVLRGHMLLVRMDGDEEEQR